MAYAFFAFKRGFSVSNTCGPDEPCAAAVAGALLQTQNIMEAEKDKALGSWHG